MSFVDISFTNEMFKFKYHKLRPCCETGRIECELILCVNYDLERVQRQKPLARRKTATLRFRDHNYHNS